ncbi:MAG: transketolase [Coriobacteriia bacterium]|nr:transketolase [Coriobacteriia bacterium]
MFDASVVRAQAAQLRVLIIEMLTAAGSGHPGGSLSSADIVSTLYFGDVLRHDPHDPEDPSRDRFVLSKGHAAPVQYGALALAGYIDKAELPKLRSLGAMLQGHPDALQTPGIEVSTGSLGQGLSIACGMAQALKLDGEGQRVFCLLGDGELQEGQIWEAAMYAAHYGLDNLTAIVDNNNLQIDGKTDQVMDLGDIARKFEAFGWDVTSVDGHDVEALHEALTLALTPNRPRVIVAMTIKGCGVSFMEDKAQWHGNAPSADQAIQACDEIRCACGEGIL